MLLRRCKFIICGSRSQVFLWRCWRIREGCFLYRGHCPCTSLLCSDTVSPSLPRRLASIAHSFAISKLPQRLSAHVRSNFTVLASHFKPLRGRDNLKTSSQPRTIAFGNNIMYRVSSSPSRYSFLASALLMISSCTRRSSAPSVEQYAEDRVSWLHGVDGVKQVKGSAF